MNKDKLLLFIWAFLAALVLVALPSIVQTGPKLIGKSFVDTDSFEGEMDAFYASIGPAILNPIDGEVAKKEIPVSIDEIEEYRDRYGSLTEQIANIYDQYEGRIDDARAVENKVLETTLVEERDKKVVDIQKNFESNGYIEEKIRADKAKVIDRYLSNIKNAEVGSFPIAYKFTDVETGETFSAGDIEVPAAYKKKFNSKDGFFKANSLPMESYDSKVSYETEWGFAGEATWSEFVSDEAVAAMGSDLTLYKKPARTFEGVVVVPKTALTAGFLGGLATDYNKGKYLSYVIWILGAMAAFALFQVLKFKKEWVTETGLVRYYDKLKIDVKAVLLFLSLFFTIEIIYSRADYLLGYYVQYYTGIWTERIGWLIVLTVAIVFIVFQLVNMIERWKQKGVFELELMDSYIVNFFRALRDMFLKTSTGIQIFILLSGFFLAGVGFVGVTLHNELVLIYLPLVLFVGLPFLYVFLRRTAYLNRIIVATEAMSAGRLQEEIKVEGKSVLAEHAANLNNLREGVRISMSEQAKSERLKTELITNVSHDLRTPLTSIITYTDLLKNENLPAEERAKYVEILDKKSQRLKTLIEDLFEVSKMASGNLELNKQRVDLTQLLQQALAEHDEEITETGLDFRISLPESALVAHIDGKRWWRVLDNLIVNAIKYTLPGTRVYITLRKIDDYAEFVVKNVTKYELGENTDELFERFKRADTSRHTDGSGLGLAIAQSIVDMHGGDMKIEVDGDLFKVTVKVLASY